MSADTLTVVKSDKEWRELLSGPSYRVLRKKGTEPAGAGRYNSFFPQSGYFACGGCGLALYSAGSKFKDCGWIAFDRCYHNGERCHVSVAKDFGGLETVCTACGGHLGHVFYGEGHTETDERH